MELTELSKQRDSAASGPEHGEPLVAHAGAEDGSSAEVAALRSTLAALMAERGAQAAELAQLREACKALASERDRAEEDADSIYQARLFRAEQRANERGALRDHRDAKAMQRKLEASAATLQAVYRSTSWRVTAPMRKVRRMLFWLW